MTRVERIRIDEGGVLDLEDVMRVMTNSFDPNFGEAWTAPQCAGLLPMPGVWLILARDGDRPVGFALARIIGEEAELLLLAVSRDAQGGGLGRSLLAGFERGARERGATGLHLEVRDRNHAVELYTRTGFVEVGRRKDYYRGSEGQVYDALTLAKASEP